MATEPSSRITFDRVVKITLEVVPVGSENPICVSGWTSTSDLRSLVKAAQMWKTTNLAVDDLRRVMDSLVHASQVDSENIARKDRQ